MGVFRKIFGSNTDASKSKADEKDQSKFLDTSNLPVDEAFTINFNKNGGKFLYCENNDEVQDFLKVLLKKIIGTKKKLSYLINTLKEKFKTFQVREQFKKKRR